MQKALNHHIHELNGYLSCLSRLCGPAYVFAAHAYQVEADVDSFVREAVAIWREGDEYIPASEIQYAGKSIIGYSQLQSEIAGCVTNGLLGPRELSAAGRRAAVRLLFSRYYRVLRLSIYLDESGGRISSSHQQHRSQAQYQK